MKRKGVDLTSLLLIPHPPPPFYQSLNDSPCMGTASSPLFFSDNVGNHLARLRYEQKRNLFNKNH